MLELILKHEFRDGRTVLFGVLATIVVVAADQAFPHVTITPIVGLGLITFIALQKSVRELLIWVGIFTVASLAVLVIDRHNLRNPEGETVRLIVRIGMLFLGYSIAVGLCVYRNRLQSSYKQILQVLEKIPAATVVSDASGKILLMSENAARLLQRPMQELIESSYFDHFILGTKGTSIQRYMALLRSTGAASELDITLREGNQPTKASLLVLWADRNHRDAWILTTFRLETAPENPLEHTLRNLRPA